MASQIEICNLALTRLGQAPIGDLNEGSNPANYCNQLWNPVRRAALRSHPWNFALLVIKNLVYAPGSPTPATALADPNFPLDIPGNQTGFTYAYVMPTDCVRVVRVIDPALANVFLSSGTGFDDNFDAFNFDSTRFGFFDPPETFELRSGGLLCSNIPCAGLKYIFDVTDTSKFDDRFVEALSYRLAMDLAMPITGSPQITQQMAQMFTSSIQAARLADGQESRKRLRSGQSFIQARG